MESSPNQGKNGLVLSGLASTKMTLKPGGGQEENLRNFSSG